MVKVFKRIVGSKKAWLTSIFLLGDLGAAWGLDVPVEQMTQGFLLYWNAAGGLLVGLQGVIDAVNGSPSDEVHP